MDWWKSFEVTHISFTHDTFFDLRGRRLIVPLNIRHPKPKQRKPKPKRDYA